MMYRNMMYNVPLGGAFSAITVALTFSSCGSHPHAALTRCVQLLPQKGLNHDLRVLAAAEVHVLQARTAVLRHCQQADPGMGMS